jgi:hypothetical protein
MASGPPGLLSVWPLNVSDHQLAGSPSCVCMCVHVCVCVCRNAWHVLQAVQAGIGQLRCMNAPAFLLRAQS